MSDVKEYLLKAVYVTILNVEYGLNGLSLTNAQRRAILE